MSPPPSPPRSPGAPRDRGPAWPRARRAPHIVDRANAAADLALAMREVIGELSARTGYTIQVRTGLASGPVVAGVIGARRFAYDL